MRIQQSIGMFAVAAAAACIWLVAARAAESGRTEVAAGDVGIAPSVTGASASRPRGIMDGDEVTESSREKAAASRRKLDAATEKVRGRLRMSAMLEAGVDPAMDAEIEEYYRSGWIIDATVEEVESALEAAAATPSPDDDVKARILAHRASCRFFVTD